MQEIKSGTEGNLGQRNLGQTPFGITLHKRCLSQIIFILIVCAMPHNAFAQVSKPVNLTLDQASELAIKNNFDIQIAKYDALIAKTDKDVSVSIYDVIFDAQAKYRNNQNKQAIASSGTKTRDDDYNIGLSKKFSGGTTVSVDLDNNRHWTDAATATETLTYNSDLSISIDQDLGKNFLGIQDRGSVDISIIDIQKAQYTSLEKIEADIAEVQNAYWDLVLHLGKVKVALEMVSQSKALYELNQEKLKDGLVEIPEAIASEANYRNRKNELFLAENFVKTKENVLKLFLNLDDENIEIIPSQKLELVKGKKELSSALKDAFENRRDYKRLKKDIEAKDITLLMKKNNAWPEINLVASLNRNGIGGHIQEAVENIFEEDNPDISVNLTFSFPLGNRKARSELKAAELEKARAIVGLKLLERSIAIGINDQVRNCNVYAQIAQNNKEIAALQAQKLEEEKKRFNYGRSDTDTLIRFQEDLIQAKYLELESRYQHQAAVVGLELKKGTLLVGYFVE